ncbi:MAG: tyrosine-type recombinase/integrase [Planctomycetes bacterium]|nr:tyrosine-type recombinase/integrase [Planctomycetota bacterium]
MGPSGTRRLPAVKLLPLDLIQNLPLAENTRKTLLSAGRDFNRYLESSGQSVGSSVIESYLAELSLRSCRNTILNRLSALRWILSTLPPDRESRRLEKSLAKARALSATCAGASSSRKKIIECLSPAQVKSLWQACKGACPRKTRTGLIVKCLYQTAMKVSELIDLRLEDCSPDGESVLLRLPGNGTKAARVLELEKSLYDALREVFAGKQLLFESERGGRLDRSNIHIRIHRLGQEVFGTGLHSQVLRNSRAMALLSSGWSAEKISRHLGHSSTALTRRMILRLDPKLADPLGE